MFSFIKKIVSKKAESPPEAMERPTEVALALIQVEGYGRVIELASRSTVTRALDAAQQLPGLAREDLIVNSNRTGSLASAFVKSTGPMETAAERPGGPVSEAGVVGLSGGRDGDWTFLARSTRFPWLEHLLLRVTEDSQSEKSRMPFELAAAYEGEEFIYAYGPYLDAPPPGPDDVVAPYQTIVASNLDLDETAPYLWLEVSYDREGREWRQRFHWKVAPNGVVLLVAQALAENAPGLCKSAEEMLLGWT